MSRTDDATRPADAALLTIEGEAYAHAFLERVRSDMAAPDDLAVIVTYLRDEMLNGFCRAITRALTTKAARCCAEREMS